MKRFDGFDFVLDARLSDDEKMVRDTVRSFVEEMALPRFMEHYEKGTFPAELVKPLAELGVFGATIHGYECAGLNNVAYGLMMQELERCDSGLRSFASVQSALVMYPIHAFGSEEQKTKWLPALAKGKVIGCFGLTEADFGSNPGGMLTTAVADGNDYVLNGSKMWITNGVASNVAVVWAKLDGEVNGFIVERDRKGFDGRPSSTSCPCARATPRSSCSTRCASRRRIASRERRDSRPRSCVSNQARYGIAWGALGAAMACLHEAIEYSKDRIMFTKPIAGYQLTQKKLADMATELTLAQLLCPQLGRLKDEGQPDAGEVSMAKRNNVRKALEIARTARTILGANGISGEYQSMRHMLQSGDPSTRTKARTKFTRWWSATSSPAFRRIKDDRAMIESTHNDTRVVILGGARTPMAEWVGGKRGDGESGGALKDVSAIDLGAIAAQGRAGQDRRSRGPHRPRDHGQRAPDQRRRASTARATSGSRPACPFECRR